MIKLNKQIRGRITVSQIETECRTCSNYAFLLFVRVSIEIQVYLLCRVRTHGVKHRLQKLNIFTKKTQIRMHTHALRTGYIGYCANIILYRIIYITSYHTGVLDVRHSVSIWLTVILPLLCWFNYIKIEIILLPTTTQ